MTIGIPKTHPPTASRAAIPRTPFNWKSLDADLQRAACVGDFTIVDGGDVPLKGAMFSCIATLPKTPPVLPLKIFV
jgi:hypothetical protein